MLLISCYHNEIFAPSFLTLSVCPQPLEEMVPVTLHQSAQHSGNFVLKYIYFKS